MTVIDYANKITEIDNQLDNLMLQIIELEEARKVAWTQWNIAKKREEEREKQLSFELAV